MSNELNRRHDAACEPANTVFYLVPATPHATAVVNYARNKRLRVDTRTYGPALRVTLSRDRSSAPPRLARVGSHDEDDIYIGGRQKAHRCYFCFNGDSGELLLRDVSQQRSTKLHALRRNNGPPKQEKMMVSRQSQCAVVLSCNPADKGDRVYELAVTKEISFGLYPPFEAHCLSLHDKRLFCVRDDIEAQWPNREAYVSYTDKEYIGFGSQGHVRVVALTPTGAHVACKTYSFARQTTRHPKDSIEHTLRQLDLVRAAFEMRKQQQEESYIVPWYHHQRPSDLTIDVFMPVYWCSLADLINNGCFSDPATAKYRAVRMLHDISTALCCLSAQNAVHRDVKPENILYYNGSFYLSDFGIAKTVDESHTNVGSTYFKSPDVLDLGATQSPAMDVFSLGLTLAACLVYTRLADIYADLHTPADQWVEVARDAIMSEDAYIGPDIGMMLQHERIYRPCAAVVKEQAMAFLSVNEGAVRDAGLPDQGAAEESARAGRCEGLQPTVPPALDVPAVHYSMAAGTAIYPATDNIPCIPRHWDILTSTETDYVDDVEDSTANYLQTPTTPRENDRRRSSRLAQSPSPYYGT